MFATWSPDGMTALTATTDGIARLWDLRRETRTPAEIAALVEARVPYELRGGQLVQRHADER